MQQQLIYRLSNHALSPIDFAGSPLPQLPVLLLLTFQKLVSLRIDMTILHYVQVGRVGLETMA